MLRNLLGIGTGLALGVALFAAPASASLIIAAGETHAGDDVGSVDILLGACEASGGGIAVEVACLEEVTGMSFVTEDAFKMDDLFASDFETIVGEPDIYALHLDYVGGWFSIKTGNISCTSAANAWLKFDATCETAVKGQYFIVFENDIEVLYAVFDLLALAGDGFVLDDIGKISHITIVPLPATALLFGSALLGGGLMRRRKMIKKFGLAS